MKKIDIYDFDKTVIPFDSGSTFMFYCFLRHPYLIFLLPFYFFDVLLFLTHIIGLDHFKHHIFCFVRFINLEKNVKKFWDKHEKKIKPLYEKLRSDDDLIITASPDFNIEEICRRLGIKRHLTSRVDRESGKILFVNIRENKIKAYEKEYGDIPIENFYTDSPENDAVLIEKANHAFVVKKNTVTQIK